MISYFTAFHKSYSDLLQRAYHSLLAQDSNEWEWIILKNGGGRQCDLTFLKNDERVKIFRSETTRNIGALKKECVSYCTGEIVAELDYDDELTSNCTSKLIETFSDLTIDFAYSDCYELKDGVPFSPYSNYYGWKYYEKDGLVTASFDPSPASLSYIWYAPNHIRAWRKSFYDSIGGHDSTLEVCDDFDLVCRTYIHGNMVHIKEPLYKYHHTNENTSGQISKDNRNAKIQELTHTLHDKYIQDICLKWCKLNNYSALDFGGRFDCPKGFVSVDLRDADIIMDLEKAWEIPDNSVGVIRASHILEHLHDTIHFFNEAFRVLIPSGFLLIEVPSTSGSGAFSDPTHVKFFNKRSFEYYTNQNISKYIQPQFKGKFQKNRINEYFWENSDVSVIQCHMIALKGDYENNWIGEKLM